MRLLSRLSPDSKRKLRALYRKYHRRFVETFLSYGRDELLTCLRSLGIRDGDSVLLHSEFDLTSGFREGVDAIIDTFLDAVGSAGNLLMVSLPYRSSSYEYLTKSTCFDVNTTPSQMGLISELFRRRRGVLRSLHPTHPVLAYGPQATSIVAGHEHCVFPCGPGTPFEKLLTMNGKAVFFNVPFSTFTFLHYLEHLVRDSLPFPLYDETLFGVVVIDRDGRPRTVRTYAFSREAIRRRRVWRLEKELRRLRLLRSAHVGNTRILCVSTADAVRCTREMAQRGELFYDLAGRSSAGSQLAEPTHVSFTPPGEQRRGTDP
jgi:aminoglycoside 3-N-acetyltransferase